MESKIKSATVSPERSLEVLSRSEVRRLLDAGDRALYQTFRRCALAVLNCGSPVDDAREVFDAYASFEIQVGQRERGISLEIRNAPASAFVDGVMIRGIREHLFAVLRDIVYLGSQRERLLGCAVSESERVTDGVFHMLRNAKVLRTHEQPNLVVCWGGHSISREEYDYSKDVGYELGLRSLNVCTGCGPGAMKGPMKGATIGHAKQRIYDGRYVGVSEPGIIAAEPPNPIVNELVIMPDMEKRLEAFVRLGHGFVIFPGGVGTAEEFMFLLGLLLLPENAELPFPLVLTGPAEGRAYFEQLNHFVGATLGPKAQRRYKIIIDDPPRVAREMRIGVDKVRQFREEVDDAYYFNWRLRSNAAFQEPFEPSHDNMEALELHREQPVHELAVHLRRAFSGIVAGNVKDAGIRAVEAQGPFTIRGEAAVIEPLEKLLGAFVAQGRMKLPGRTYRPCYRVQGPAARTA